LMGFPRSSKLASQSSMSGLAIITGSGRGIGAATAKLAALRGYSVAVNYVSDAESARRVVDWIAGQGGRAAAFQADTSDERDVERLFAEASGRFGPVVALVNNAGVPGRIGRVAD